MQAYSQAGSALAHGCLLGWQYGRLQDYRNTAAPTAPPTGPTTPNRMISHPALKPVLAKLPVPVLNTVADAASAGACKSLVTPIRYKVSKVQRTMEEGKREDRQCRNRKLKRERAAVSLHKVSHSYTAFAQRTHQRSANRCAGQDRLTLASATLPRPAVGTSAVALGNVASRLWPAHLWPMRRCALVQSKARLLK